MLASATKTNDKEVWCALSDIANICAARLVPRLQNKSGSHYGSSADSWTTQTFPGSTIKLRLDMSGSIHRSRYDYATKQHIEFEQPKMSFYCKVKVSGTTTERFTQAMINDYITDKILLGDFEGLDDDEQSVLPETISGSHGLDVDSAET